MKVTVDVDCTPEEVRRFMGLPDMSSVHEVYLERLRQTVDEGISPASLETLIKSWAPVGEAGMTMWRQMIDQMGGTSPKK